MKWSRKEDEIVCRFYLSHKDSWRKEIDVVMNELKQAGFVNRDENSTRMRISNFSYLHTGTGLSNAAIQSVDVYNEIIKK